MILGLGVDLVDVQRMDKILKVWGQKFTSRIFTQNEIKYCSRKVNAAECFAARFAAKEALAKALGHGFCEHFKWKDVDVVKEDSGKPTFSIRGITARLVENKRVFLSISHTKSQAMAFVTIERE